MAEETTNLVEEAALEMDEMLAGVMPDTWMGHARIAIATRDLSDKDKADALAYTEQLVEENDYPSADVVDTVLGKMDLDR